MNIGNAIKELRIKRGFNQIDFADKCGLSQSYLSLIEKGKKEPTLSLLKKISSTLSMPMPILVFFSLDKNDVVDSKKAAFQLLEPSIKGLINDVFVTESV
jgi:transcriptional regulator with XRE-family HTH domain